MQWVVLFCLLFPKILLSIGCSVRGLDGISHDISFFVCLQRALIDTQTVRNGQVLVNAKSIQTGCS